MVKYLEPGARRTTPRTDEERSEGLAALERIKVRHARWLAERGGKPFSSTVGILHELREERDHEIDAWFR